MRRLAVLAVLVAVLVPRLAASGCGELVSTWPSNPLTLFGNAVHTFADPLASGFVYVVCVCVCWCRPH